MIGVATPGAVLSGSEVSLPVRDLVLGGSPRVDGPVAEHVRMLTGRDPEVLPPIVVQRDTLRVVDGEHRVRAAVLREDERIRAVLCDGTESECFLYAVRSNIAHGLPLSLESRRAAAVRIVREFPGWSDHVVAELAGLSDKTVGALRRSTAENPESNTARIGRDGRARPLSAAEGRRQAGALLAEEPGLSLREVARRAGISLGTAHDVRRRLDSGQDPVPDQRRSRTETVPEAPPRVDAATLLRQLRTDPALRSSEPGRVLLHLLSLTGQALGRRSDILGAVPPHCLPAVAAMAEVYARDLSGLAEQIRAALPDPR